MTHWKVDFHHATENFEYWKAFYCKFTTDAGADDLIQAFVEANGGSEDTQINTWSIKFGQSQESETDLKNKCSRQYVDSCWK